MMMAEQDMDITLPPPRARGHHTVGKGRTGRVRAVDDYREQCILDAAWRLNT